MAWLYRAGALPGQALAVGVVLWHEAGCRKSRTVPFRISKCRKFRIHEDTARRGLQVLEKAGLIAIRRLPGRCSEVTILEATTDSSKPGRDVSNFQNPLLTEAQAVHLTERLNKSSVSFEQSNNQI
jgi:hypothetical protein